MEKKIKIFKLITIILIIIAVSLVSFVGAFRKKLNFTENLIPELTYGMEIAGARQFEFTLDTASEEKNVYVDENENVKGEVIEDEDTSSSSGISLDTTVAEAEANTTNTDVVAEEEVNKVQYATETRTIKANEDSVLNKENYEKTKAIIQSRLDKAQIQEYNMRLDNVTGKLIIEVPENDDADTVYELAIQKGVFEIIDAETGVVLMDNSLIKKASAVYYTNSGYQAFLQIEFTKEGAEILKKISNEYVQVVTDTNETENKKVALKLDDSTLLETYFGEELSQGILQITIGQATTDYDTFVSNYDSASYFANIINSGPTPNAYTLASDNFVKSQITEDMILKAKVAFAGIIAIVSCGLILKYKSKGALSALASIGYIAVTVLAVRYTNVTITLNSLIAFLGIVIVNYIFVVKYMNKQKTDSAKHAFLETMKELNVTIIPLWIVAVIFTFMTNMAICSVGMILFWGLFVHIVYSFLITRTLYV